VSQISLKMERQWMVYPIIFTRKTIIAKRDAVEAIVSGLVSGQPRPGPRTALLCLTTMAGENWSKRSPLAFNS
jgi:hypothetical protein